MKRSKAKIAKWSRAVKERAIPDDDTAPVCELFFAIKALYEPTWTKGQGEGIQAHHMVPRSQWPGGILEPRNGVAVCKKAHDYMDGCPIPKQEAIYDHAGRLEDYLAMRKIAGKETT